MHLSDSRRLMGPNLYSVSPGAIAEVTLDDLVDARALVAAWRSELARMLRALGWGEAELHHRVYRGGAALFLAAAFDVLLPATEVMEWAVESAIHVAGKRAPLPLEPVRSELAMALASARRPELHPLADAARARELPLTIDDEAVTVGAGARSVTWHAGEVVPAVDDVPWSTLGGMPTALVTGTNGKTTTVRLVARMARLAGRHPGTTSSDGVAVDEHFIERGDWSGPDGARRVLRHRGVDLAILETARGGILRRGLAVQGCDAAVITNVTADHLGNYGIDDVATMAQVKAVVLRDARTVVLNADDPVVVALAATVYQPLIYFSMDPTSPVIAAHRSNGGEAWIAEGGAIVHALGDEAHPVMAIADAPITFGGRAVYNVENVLAAAALATALGLSEDEVVAGLRDFTSSTVDNPGRGNLMTVGGVQVLLDFGHNPAAVRGVIALARALAGEGALRVTIGMPGDRPDDEIAEVAREILAGAPRRVLVRELPAHLRGRAAGDVPALLLAVLGRVATIAHDELIAVRAMIDESLPGDVVLVLVHLDSRVDAFLAARGAH